MDFTLAARVLPKRLEYHSHGGYAPPKLSGIDVCWKHTAEVVHMQCRGDRRNNVELPSDHEDWEKRTSHGAAGSMSQRTCKKANRRDGENLVNHNDSVAYIGEFPWYLFKRPKRITQSR